MPQLGRYIIDRPTPPTAIEQLGGNINKLGQLYVQKQLEEQQRKKKLEDAIALEKAKAEIDTSGKESLLNRIIGGGIPQTGQTANQISGSPQPVFRPKGFTYEGVNFERQPSEEERASARSSKLEDEIAKKELSSMTTNLPKLQQAYQSVDQLEELFKKGASPDKNPIVSRISGVGDVLGAKMGFNPYLNSYINNARAFSGLIAKGGFGEAGMLTNQDIERVLSALPTAMSTPEEAKIGFSEIKKLLGAAKERFEKTKKSYLDGSLVKPTFGSNQQKNIQPTFGQKNNFMSEEEAISANLKPGTRITINGRPAIWE